MKLTKDGILVNKDGDTFTLSLSPQLQEEAGHIVYVDVEEKENVEVDEPILNFEAEKAVMELSAPFKGHVVEINDTLSDNPDHLDETDLDKNWFIKMDNVKDEDFDVLDDAKK